MNLLTIRHTHGDTMTYTAYVQEALIAAAREG